MNFSLFAKEGIENDKNNYTKINIKIFTKNIIKILLFFNISYKKQCTNFHQLLFLFLFFYLLFIFVPTVHKVSNPARHFRIQCFPKKGARFRSILGSSIAYDKQLTFTSLFFFFAPRSFYHYLTVHALLFKLDI